MISGITREGAVADICRCTNIIENSAGIGDSGIIREGAVGDICRSIIENSAATIGNGITRESTVGDICRSTNIIENSAA